MVTTRRSAGTLPSATFESVISGSLIRPQPRGRGRPRLHDSPVYNIDGDEERPKKLAKLKVPHYAFELAELLGDQIPPYYGLFADDLEDSNNERTRPSAEDWALFQRLNHNEPIRDHCVDNNRKSIHFGLKWTMDTWYRSSYPAEYANQEYMSICGFCLDYKNSDFTAERHDLKCRRRCPPGREIYRDNAISMWEVDGSHDMLYCQNLCLLAKLFLSSKALFHDVQPFYFYVLTETDSTGSRFLGYFSKQKYHSTMSPNEPIQSVSCIMALPSTQKRGYGQFLIDFSYLLTRQQRATGTPEKPLSGLGYKAFESNWKIRICYAVREAIKSRGKISVSSISTATGMTLNDVVFTLEILGWLKRSWSKSPHPQLRVDGHLLSTIIFRWEQRQPLVVKPELLLWVPPVQKV